MQAYSWTQGTKIAALALPLMLSSACGSGKMSGDAKSSSTDLKDAGPNSGSSTSAGTPGAGTPGAGTPGAGGSGTGGAPGAGGLGAVLGGLTSIIGNLSGGGCKKPAAAPTAAKPTAALTDSSLTPQQKAITQCLKNWGDSPFTATSPYRAIHASVSVFGQGTAVDDETVTPAPALIVIDAAVNVLGTPTYKLLNPNGWYCVVANVNVLSSVEFTLKNGAHLSSTAVGVNVIGDTEGTAGSTDVNVLSCEKVTVVP